MISNAFDVSIDHCIPVGTGGSRLPDGLRVLQSGGCVRPDCAVLRTCQLCSRQLCGVQQAGIFRAGILGGSGFLAGGIVGSGFLAGGILSAGFLAAACILPAGFFAGSGTLGGSAASGVL